MLVFRPSSLLLIVGLWCAPIADLLLAQETGLIAIRTAEMELRPNVTVSGRIVPMQSVELRPLHAGIVTKIHIQGGELVKAGDLLFELDDRHARLELTKAEAELALAAVTAKRLEAELSRANKLREAGAIQATELERLESEAEAAKISLRAEEAVLQLAKLRLEQCRILAPFDGQVSTPHFSPGSLVQPHDPPLATLINTSRFLIEFHIPERTALPLIKIMQSGGLQGAKNGIPIAVSLGSNEPWIQDLSARFVELKFSQPEGAAQKVITARAELPTETTGLVTGMRATVVIYTENPRRVVVVPDEDFQQRSLAGSQETLVVDDQNRGVMEQVKFGPWYYSPQFERVRVINDLAAGKLLVLQGRFSRVDILSSRTSQPVKIGKIWTLGESGKFELQAEQ